ncbi:class I histocompatibility antigen, F10 alpha chain isoform X1 [Chelonia mydas]|uniref:class I histocompatibility antigen, F10 alpha chain isoform X1 n=3 Tax=Chelonia mydas TaxID=8469 RepID=UPI001CA8C8E2|nr:class I histocompatibility antigen, F10 alpha chain isoform X1 [Chelonia mydas]
MEQRPRPGSESRLRAGQPRGHGPRRAEPARPLPLGLSLPSPAGVCPATGDGPGPPRRHWRDAPPPSQSQRAGGSRGGSWLRPPRRSRVPGPRPAALRGVRAWRCASCCRCWGLQPCRGPDPEAAAQTLRSSAARIELGLHSRRVLSTVVSEPGPGLPWFSRVGYVDDQAIFVYAGGMQSVEPRTAWMAQNEGPELWDFRLLWSRRWEAGFNASLNTLAQLYNRTEGFHIIQTIFGCDLREDNTTRGFYQDSYDGRDFLTFDKETMTWVAADIGAQITKRRWDAEIGDNQRWKRYLEEDCISWLRSSLEYGKERLQRKVHPTARVSDRSSHDGLTTLSCKVSGFYPRDITVTWLKNGESRQQETYSEGILPSGDGTYQTWVTMEIDPKIKAHYSCHVEHESLLEPLSASWEPNNNLIPTVAGVITAVVLIGVIIGVVVWKKKYPGKKGDGYAVAQANDQGSSGSDLSAKA